MSPQEKLSEEKSAEQKQAEEKQGTTGQGVVPGAGGPGRKRAGGPRTPEGKARSSPNSLKTGAYAKTDQARREIMLRKADDPGDFDRYHAELTESWLPDNVMEAMPVKSIAEKSFEHGELGADCSSGGAGATKIPSAMKPVSSNEAAIASGKRAGGGAPTQGLTEGSGSSSGQNGEIATGERACGT